MSLQNLGKQGLRVVKNYTKGYSDVQAKVRDATSNDPWGPTGALMNEIARLTFNQQDFIEIMEMLDKRLNDKGKNWRHVWKSLTLLDYLLHEGSENVILYFRENLYIIKTLKEFQFIDENQKDEGANVRQKAKDITNLLQDDSRLREQRRSRQSMRDRMAGRESNGLAEGENENTHRRSGSASRRDRPKPGGGNDEDELRKALAESRRTAVEEKEKRELEEAIKLSEQEEANRNKSLEEANQRALFDEQAQNPSISNNPFPLVDASAQFPQSNLQPQSTAMAPQFTSFNPYAQQAQQEAMQQQYMMQQQDWMRQQQAQQEAQQQALYQQQQQEEWNRQQQILAYQQQQQQQYLQAQQSYLAPQQTSFASNNPFALNTQTQGMMSAPSLNTTSSLDSFSLPSTFANSQTSSSSSGHLSHSPPPLSNSAPPVQRPTRDDGQHAHLANLIGNREDGIDTFGNFGQLRLGHANTGNVMGQNTGANPFAKQQSNEQPFFSLN